MQLDLRGRDNSNSDSVATLYGLDGLGLESQWVEIFQTCPDSL